MKWPFVVLVIACAGVGCARATGEGANSGSGGSSGAGAAQGGNRAPDMAVAEGDMAPSASASDLAAAPADLAPVASTDLALPVVSDMAQLQDLATVPADVVVHVLIDNFCNSSTNPTVIDATHGVALQLTFENDSHDYDADVWSSRGYGFLDMAQGMTWKDPVQHCTGPNPSTEYFDVGINGGPVGDACPNYRLQIHCN